MKQKILLSFILLSLLTYFLLGYINQEKEKAIHDFNMHSLLTVKATYAAVIDTYEIAAKKDFNSLMATPKIVKILHTLKNTKNTNKRNILRGELYRLLYKPYQEMKKMHVRQFHLHTHDGKSLLRMHLPYESEDLLLGVRTSIEVANMEHKSIIGFEGGRIFPGFRYVYPVIDMGEYLGSVEFSISFEGIEEKLTSLLPIYRYQLLMSKKETYDKVFKWHRSFFSVSLINNNYYVENPELSIITKRNMRNNVLSNLENKVKQSANFNEKLAKHKDFSVSIIENNKAQTVNFINIENTDNIHAGYIVYFGEEDEIVNIVNDYNTYKIITFFLIMTVFVLLVIVINQIEKLRQSKNKLQLINNSFSEAQKIAHFGSVEYNHIEDKYYLSDEVYNIFGTTPEKFKVSYKVLLSHVHPDDVKMVHKRYTESIKNKTPYMTQHRLVQDSGNIIFVEEHGNHVLNEEGKIIKSIGSIYDITQQMKAYKNLEKFIDLQTAIVILTDGNEFQFANKSFYNFFGFENLAAFTKQYACICERFIENDEFFSLTKVKEGEENWLESLLNYSVRQRIVSMLDSTATPHAFSVTINKYDQTIYEVEFNDISDSMIEKLQLEKQLNRDQLTKVYNRVYFETHIQHIMKLNKEQNTKTGIVFFDIDHFKSINDTYGHDVGDNILVSLTQVVKEQIRGYDHLVRWGGEEFIIIVRVESQENILQMTEKIRVKIQNHNFEDIRRLTCSFGIAIYKEDETISSTITRADEKLYDAKNNGRNQIQI